MKKLLSIPEAAAEVGVTTHALRLRIWRGQFPCVRWGSRVFVSRDQIEKFVAALPGTQVEEAAAKAEEVRD